MSSLSTFFFLQQRSTISYRSVLIINRRQSFLREFINDYSIPDENVHKVLSREEKEEEKKEKREEEEKEKRRFHFVWLNH